MSRKAAGAVSLTVLSRRVSRFAMTAVAAAVATVGAAPAGVADQVRDQEWWLTAVHVTKVWKITRGAGMTVAVLDTGVDPSQPDLSGSVTMGPDFTRSGRHRGDTYWGVHGTAMAALIAGHGHGPRHADGIMGVAPKSKIMSVRVTLEELDPLRGDAAASKLPGAIAAGIRYAASHGAMVIDLPLDPGAAFADGSPGAAAAAGGATAERRAVSYALSKGIVLVAPAGDDGPGPGQVNYPAAYPGVISAGAFDKTFTKSQFSSRGSYVTLTGPGEDMVTATPGTGYTVVSSTSAASAEVAGMAALIRARYPSLTPQQVGQALAEGTRYHPAPGRRNGSGFGTADAARALNAAANLQPATQPPSSAAPSGTPRQAAHPARNQRSALTRDAVIGAAGLILVLSLVLMVRLSAHRRRALSRPPYGPPPTRPLSARSNEPEMPAAAAAEPRKMPASEPRRPELGPIPSLGTGKRPRPAEGPPWEPAPRPDSEPPWRPADPVANGEGLAGPLAHPPPGGSPARNLAHPPPGSIPAGGAAHPPSADSPPGDLAHPASADSPDGGAAHPPSADSPPGDLAHPAPGANGHNDATWRTEDATWRAEAQPLAPPVQRDPATGPAGAAPGVTGYSGQEFPGTASPGGPQEDGVSGTLAFSGTAGSHDLNGSAGAGPSAASGRDDLRSAFGTSEPYAADSTSGWPSNAAGEIGQPADSGFGTGPRHARNSGANTGDFPVVSSEQQHDTGIGSWPAGALGYQAGGAPAAEPGHLPPETFDPRSGAHLAADEDEYDSQPFPVIPPPDAGSYPADDEDDRHL